MFVTSSALLFALLAAEASVVSPNAVPLAPGAAAPATDAVAEAVPVAGQRQRRSAGPQKRGIHELQDPSGWPEEPAAPAGPLEAERFDAAVVKLCGEVAPDAGLAEVARLVRDVSAEAGADPFLTAALVYRESRCRPGLTGAAGIGLLQIQPAMFAAGAPLPFARAELARDRLLDPAQNLRTGLALLKMWEADHLAVDRAVGSTPHRSAVAHFFWGDHVWGTTSEDRTLTARRRLLQAYTNPPVAMRPSSLGIDIVSPLEGAPRLGTSGPGADREGGERYHRGVDVDATIGEPVRAVADGVVQFAGADMLGDHPALDLQPRQLRRWRTRNLGPGGFFVRVMHADGVRSGYFHLNGYRVVAGQAVRAGEVIGTVGRTGVKVSGSHLHFEVHRAGELEDPVRFLHAYVLPPDQTITHQLAMAEKRQRLARVSRLRRHARITAQHRLS
jgi:murein DD-endopeptidase MepM/ murein hydrolase activator NlpD